MFEKVTQQRADRRAFLRLHGFSAAVAAHAACALGITTLSLAAPAAEQTVETATYLLLQAPVTLPVPPIASANGARRTATPRPRGRRDAPQQPADAAREMAERLVQRLERALPAPSVTVDALPPPGPELDASLLRGLGEVGAKEMAGEAVAGGFASEDDGGGAPLVNSEVLANPPQIVNRNTVARVMGEDYPGWLMDRGVEGQVVVAFIIGVDGRAEMNHVQVLSASHRDFIPAAMRGLRRMRFRPAELDGRRVRVRVSLPLVWLLPGAR
ncbi:MAG TPA: energy transducer TonB [Longimicrobium sp.]